MNRQLKTILLVEDEKMVSVLHSRILRNAGYNVVISLNGEDSIEIVNNNKSINLILMDIDLGVGIDGTEAALEIQKNHNIPIVFLSSHTDMKIVDKTKKITSYGYIPKNVGDAVLLTSIEMAFKLHDANLKMQKQKEELQIILDSVPAMIFYKDLENRIVQANKSFFETLQTNSESLINKPLTEFFTKEQGELYFKDDLEVINSGKPKKNITETMETFRGTRWLKTDKIPYRDENGNIVGVIGFSQDITEHKQAEEMIQENEKRFRSVIETAGDAIITIDEFNNIIFWNNTARKIFGYSGDEIIGTSLKALMPERFREMHPKYLTNRVLTGKGNLIGKTVEIVALRKNGSEFPIELSLSIWKNKEKTFYTGIIRDITERKQADESIRKLSTAVEQSPLSIVITDTNGSIEYVNPKFTLLTGYTYEEAMGQNPRILKTGATSIETYKKLWETIASGNIWEGEFYNVKKNGEFFWENAKISPVKNKDGVIINYLAIKEDITERKQMETALKSSEERFRTVFEQAPIGIALIDKITGIISDVNSRFAMIIGRIKDEIIGLDWMSITNSEDVRKDIDNLVLLNSGDISRFNADNRFIRSDNSEVWVNMAIALLKEEDKDHHHYLSMVEDITKRKEAENEINRLNLELTQYSAELENLNKELESFSYSVSHDLRNPLKIIDGFSNILLEDYSDKIDDEGKVFINNIQIATSRMNQLITDMLSLAVTSKAEINRTDIDLSLIAGTVAQSLQDLQTGRKVEFIIEQGITVNADEGLIKVVMENLLGNAWKYSGKGDNPKIEFGVTEIEGRKTYFVRDNGAGFDMKFSENLFAPFKRLHSNKDFEGTGIGLATVYRIINRHGGKIWAEGKVEEGAVFFFTVG